MRTETIPAAIKSLIPKGHVTTIEYEPGNGSRYTVVLINNTTDTKSHYVVAVMILGQGTCMTVNNSGLTCPLSPLYVSEKLQVARGHGVILAELIAMLTGRGVAADASDPESYK